MSFVKISKQCLVMPVPRRQFDVAYTNLLLDAMTQLCFHDLTREFENYYKVVV